MELELQKLEDLAQAIVSDFAYMKSREKLMRDTNGKLLWDETTISSAKLYTRAGNFSHLQHKF